MSDQFHPVPLKLLLQWILSEYRKNRSIFGMNENLFFYPHAIDRYATQLFGKNLSTPIGVAAGPHSQMAQNIVAAWLTGARYIELKTVQTLDELDISKPCIDMQDEGYNCEWSQELKIRESFDEYLKAWVLIHVLQHLLGMEKSVDSIFNMSVGYDLKGIMQTNVQWFFNKMQYCPDELSEKIKEIREIYPEVTKLNIAPKISDNITLSTMHGCPANEIEDIAKYLLKEKKLHTFVKLNPTLLGPERLRNILNDTLHFKTHVPDEAFEHDLKYQDAVRMIKSLSNTATEEGLDFGLKLTNTLESENHKNVFPKDVSMMYMSGRALHPLSIALAHRLQNEFNGTLKISFSGGVTAMNVADTLSCGFVTVTVCTDLLKPGGYTRFHQYFKEINRSFDSLNARNLNDFILKKSKQKDDRAAKQINLERYASQVLKVKDFRRTYLKTPDIKNNRNLSYFDCIAAPCEEACPTNQDIPSYLFHTSKGDFEKAYQVISQTNAFPNATGMVCDHVCQTQCTRINYDEPLAIRDIKRFVVEWHNKKITIEKNIVRPDVHKKIAVIGAGPTGLSSAYFLRKAGFEVQVYESKSKAGGMVSGAIPAFRISDESVALDVNHIEKMGVQVHYNSKVDGMLFQELRKESDAVIVAVGAQAVPELKIEGMSAHGVYAPLEFLQRARKGEKMVLGETVTVVGGGNTAMDVARTAFRMIGKNGKVRLIYRRSVHQMPAVYQEIVETLEEGVELMEWVNPVRVLEENGKVTGLECVRMKAGEADETGRLRPIEIEDSSFTLSTDAIIPAIGQKISVDFIDKNQLQTKENSFETQLDNVYIGGDARLGAASLIKGVGDGRKIAQEIINRFHVDFDTRYSANDNNWREQTPLEDLMYKKSKRIYGEHPQSTALDDRKNFNMITQTFTEEQAVNEASRCLLCDEVCNICTTVCPNLANFSYHVSKTNLILKKGVNSNGKMIWIADKPFEISQEIQILNIANFCNECGNCATFCPTNSAPYLVKPKIYLTRQDFENAENGYYLETATSVLWGKKNGEKCSLKKHAETYVYEDKTFVVKLDMKDFAVLDAELKTDTVKTLYLQNAAEMSIIMQGAELLEFG